MRPPKAPPITKSYAKLLEEKMVEVERGTRMHREALADASGMGRSTLWRVLNAKPSVSLEKVEEVRSLINRHLTGTSLPPPVAPVENQAHYEAIELARQLLSDDPEYLAKLVEHMRARVLSMSLVEATTNATGVTPPKR